MPYRFAHERLDLSDFASGRVFHSLPGRTGFPVRLADEIFQRCQALRPAHLRHAPATLYDPCCGGATMLCALAFQHWHALGEIVASDADAEAVALAGRNLALLTPGGLAERRAALQALHQQFGKASHAEAEASAERLGARLAELRATHDVPTRHFVADALDGAALAAHLRAGTIDMVVTDVPYGQHSDWIRAAGADPPADPIWSLLEALRPVLAADAVVAIVSDKGQRARHERYTQVGRLQIGKRRATFLTSVS
jgi:hypothetical protein